VARERRRRRREGRDKEKVAKGLISEHQLVRE